MNRRVLSGCTFRADGQYGTTCCPSQRNRDTLSEAGESALRTVFKVRSLRARTHNTREYRDFPPARCDSVSSVKRTCARARAPDFVPSSWKIYTCTNVNLVESAVYTCVVYISRLCMFPGNSGSEWYSVNADNRRDSESWIRGSREIRPRSFAAFLSLSL